MVDVGVVKVLQRLTTIAGVEGHSVAVTTLTDIRKEIDKVQFSLVHGPFRERPW